MTDEFLAAFHELWTSDTPRFAGKYASFTDIRFAPKPVQKPRPPIWVGGEGRVALRRVARLGDGWYPVGNNPQEPRDTPGRYAEKRTLLEAELTKVGRDPRNIAPAYLAPAAASRAR